MLCNPEIHVGFWQAIIGWMVAGWLTHAGAKVADLIWKKVTGRRG